MQTTSHILMIKPVNFAFNAETAENNAFQVRSDLSEVQSNALHEFEAFVVLLRNNGVDVLVVEDTPHPHTPDSIFPNNWVSFHQDGTVLLYPMHALSRRGERKIHVLEKINERFSIKNKIDLSYNETSNLFLEGTGSMVLDRENKIAYACLSPRTDKEVLDEFCRLMTYEPVAFTAFDKQGRAIYHTNVMMCVADKYAVICLEAIPATEERLALLASVQKTNKEIIEINYEQLEHFAGNMLQIENNKGEKLLIMSTQAYDSLTPSQAQKLSAFNRVIHSPLNTIETNGGGSARCMMAEIHLPVLK